MWRNRHSMHKNPSSTNIKSWKTMNAISAASWQNQQNGMCAQQRLRSAWTSAQSDQSLRCPHEESLGPWLPTERTAKTLIRLGGCPGWSESSLGGQSFCWFYHEGAHLIPYFLTLLRIQTHFTVIYIVPQCIIHFVYCLVVLRQFFNN